MTSSLTRNIIITPIVIFIRAPIMLTGYVMKMAGQALWNLGDHVPGWKG
jgi:hypothetical protein